MIILDAKQYIESQNIRVFPCAYRGYYTDDKTLVFDPEARATTEANFTNTFHKLSDNKESYVIAWVPNSATDIDGSGTLKCVIGGYYFEIYNHAMSEFFYSETDPEDSKPKPKPYYLCIKTESISLGTSKPDSTRITKVLSSFAASTNYLDVKDTQGRYAFTGLLISKTADESATASLAPFIAIPKATDGYEYKIDAAKLPITNLLDVGSGNYSIRMVEDDTEQGSNTTIASGDYSVALGLKTTATGEASTALGNNTVASSKGAFAVGNNTNASGEGAAALGDTTTASGANAVALGSNTKAEADNQVVMGAYNEKDDNQAFIVANGNDNSNRSNKFTVSKNGDVKALGTLETKGSIKATGDSNNSLELGTPAAGSSGSIKVYGTGEAKAVFTVEHTGKTTISGATTITNTTESTSTSTGALKVTGGVGIAKNLNIGGELSVEKLATLKAGAAITGNVEITGDVKITGKAMADKTTTTDADATLTTKSYVDDAAAAVHTHIMTVINALYPIGSIYMQYVDSETDPPKACPLTAILTESKWELIKNGRFLRSVGAADYARGNEGGSENTVLIKHTHKYTLMAEGADGCDYGITYENGNHTHGIAATSAGTGPFTGFDGQRGDDTSSNILYVSTAGAHQHYLPNITAVTENDVAEGVSLSNDGKGANLPPYLNVYMWRRVPNIS